VTFAQGGQTEPKVIIKKTYSRPQFAYKWGPNKQNTNKCLDKVMKFYIIVLKE